MEMFDIFKKTPKPTTLPADRMLHKETFRVIGIGYHEADIKRLATPRPEYRTSAKKILAEGKAGEKIYHYEYVTKPVDIVPDPKSETRYSSLKVVIAGQVVGYIKEDDILHVTEILQYASIKYLLASVTGGEYKIVRESGSVAKWDDGVKISLSIGYAVK